MTINNYVAVTAYAYTEAGKTVEITHTTSNRIHIPIGRVLPLLTKVITPSKVGIGDQLTIQYHFYLSTIEQGKLMSLTIQDAVFLKEQRTVLDLEEPIFATIINQEHNQVRVSLDQQTGTITIPFGEFSPSVGLGGEILVQIKLKVKRIVAEDFVNQVPKASVIKDTQEVVNPKVELMNALKIYAPQLVVTSSCQSLETHYVYAKDTIIYNILLNNIGNTTIVIAPGEFKNLLPEQVSWEGIVEEPYRGSLAFDEQKRELYNKERLVILPQGLGNSTVSISFKVTVLMNETYE